MKLCLVLALLSALSGPAKPAGPLFQYFDKAGYYSVMASGKIKEVDSELTVLKNAAVKEKQAYQGALMMRLAGLNGRPREKLAAFRAGATLLERSLASDSGNAEYHFLRLIIQEHAPRVVHYNKDLQLDSRDVIRAFPSLPPTLQRAVRNYSRHSNLLHESALNG